MSPAYYLYSGRMQGWLTIAGNYSSDVTQAQSYDRTSALAICRKHKDQAGYALIPVQVDDLNAI